MNVNMVAGDSVRQPPKLTSREEFISWERAMMTHLGRTNAWTIVTGVQVPPPAVIFPPDISHADRRHLLTRQEQRVEDYLKRKRNAFMDILEGIQKTPIYTQMFNTHYAQEDPRVLYQAIRDFYVDAGNATQRMIQNKLDSMYLKADQLIQDFIISLDNQFELLQPAWNDNQKIQLLGRAIDHDARFGVTVSMADTHQNLTYARYCEILNTKENNMLANETIKS